MSPASHESGTHPRARRQHPRWPILAAIVCCAVALAGCDSGRAFRLSRAGGGAGAAAPLPLPARALLKRQPEPRCEFATAGADADQRQKLDYERQCYRHAEMIARGRLDRLQDSVARTIRAVRRGDGSEL